MVAPFYLTCTCYNSSSLELLPVMWPSHSSTCSLVWSIEPVPHRSHLSSSMLAFTRKVLFISGIAPQLTVTILSLIESTKSAAKSLDWMFLVLFPNYSMGKGISDLYNNYEFMDLCFNKLPDMFENLLDKRLTLDEICDTFKQSNETFPCCKGMTSMLEYN